MQSFLSKILLLICCCQPVWAGGVSLRNLDSQEDFVIHHRLQQILMKQSEKRAHCKQRTPMSPHRFENFEWLSKPQQKEQILQLIQEIRQSRSSASACPGVKLETIQSVRKPMLPSYNLGVPALSYMQELAPSCFPVAGKGSFKTKEINACFAGDTMIVQDLKALKFSFPMDALRFAEALDRELRKSVVGGNLDIFAVFTAEFPGRGPRDLFTLLASFTTSGNSGLTGYLQGVEDHLLIEDLNRETLSELAVYERSKQLQAAKIKYTIFRDFVDRFRIRLTLFGEDVVRWNRHNFMAGYLACRDPAPYPVAVTRVHSIGIGYESKDFVSHLKERVKLKPTVENFKEDTRRYLESARVGWQACHL